MVEKVHECNELVILHRLLWMRSCELDMLQESYIVKNITYIYETTMKVPWAMALDPKQFMCSNDKLGTNKHILQRIDAWASYPGTGCRVYSERHVQQSDNLGDDYYFFSEAERKFHMHISTIVLNHMKPQNILFQLRTYETTDEGQITKYHVPCI
jgi:hypothetical protein